MMLRVLKPFSGWSLPTVDTIKFVVSSDTDCLGTYIFDDELEKHIITISKEKNGHLETVIKTMAHEMIHMKRHNTQHWDKHDIVFRKYAITVANELGFDPQEL
jgi:hypothetical protein